MVSADDAKGDSTNSGSQLCSFAQVWIDPAIGELKLLFITELSCITFVERWDMFHLWQDMFICVESDRLSAEGLCINVIYTVYTYIYIYVFIFVYVHIYTYV